MSFLRYELLTGSGEEIERLKKDNESLNKDNEELRASFQETQLEALSAGGEAFDRAKAQALVLQPDLNVHEMDFFKVIREDQLVDPYFDTCESQGVPKKDSPTRLINDDPTD